MTKAAYLHNEQEFFESIMGMANPNLVNENLNRSLDKHGAAPLFASPEEVEADRAVGGSQKVYGGPSETNPRGGVVYRGQRMQQFKIINAWIASQPPPDQLKDVADYIQSKKGSQEFPAKPWFKEDPLRKTWEDKPYNAFAGQTRT